MIGLGVSAIGDSWNTFYQNSKNLDDYYQMLEWENYQLLKSIFYLMKIYLSENIFKF
jgi:coproporphyrinogen III oxidase-like Fe-S oxidoreductase